MILPFLFLFFEELLSSEFLSTKITLYLILFIVPNYIYFINVEDFLRAVLNHPLEVRAVIRFGRVGTVDIGADHGDTVLLGVVLAVAQLPFNGRFALAVRRIASVDHGGHGKHLTLHIIKRRTVLSKCGFV